METVKRPPSCMASREFTARFMITCSICAGSDKIHECAASCRNVNSISLPSKRGSMNSDAVSARCKSITRVSNTCLRLNASSCFVIEVAFSVVR